MRNVKLSELVFYAIADTVEKFRNHPHCFFTETDLSAYLYHRLYSKELKVETRDGVLTTCMHMEYPTNFRYSKRTMEDYGFEKRGRRGNYDLVVLNPEFIRGNDIRNVVNKDVQDSMERQNRNPQAFRRELVAAVEFKYAINNQLGFISSIEKDAVKLSHGQRYQDFEAYNIVFCNLRYHYLEELREKVETLETENPIKNLLIISYFEGSKKVTMKPITNGWKYETSRTAENLF